jgi:hypothetical protein
MNDMFCERCIPPGLYSIPFNWVIGRRHPAQLQDLNDLNSNVYLISKYVMPQTKKNGPFL